jgi:D-hexose-6-phosphate mutarotase
LDTTAELTLNDPTSKRRLRVSKTGSHSSVVWNPWVAKAAALADLGDEEWREFICIEQANAARNVIQLATGHTHTFAATFTPEQIT